jgi:glycosyltransferase involved in cell wall biosynthesis
MACNFRDTRLWFVNDGSTDNTQEKLEKLVKLVVPEPGLIHISKNVGKAEAVRRGILTSLKEDSCRRCGFWDADLATPFTEFLRMSQAMDDNPKLVMVSGCRVQRLGASILRNPWRHYPGRIFAAIASIVLGIPVYDTQCGAKLFRAAVATEIFRTPFISRWSFDVEIFARLGRSISMESVLELPLLEWIDTPGSKLSLAAALRSMFDLIRIYKKYQ